MIRKLLALLLVAGLLLPGCTYSETEPAPFTIIKGEADGVFVVPEIDDWTRAFATVTYAHHEIHEGDMYTTCNVTDLANGATVNILIRTPNTLKWSHLLWDLDHELEATVTFYEAATVTANGTELMARNRDRNSSNTAGTKIYVGPTVTAVGTQLCRVQQGAGNKAGGSDRAENEWVLKQNTVYLLRITNNTANNNLISTRLIWYEHTNE